jgi:uncharacterized membrane protein YphA (DoxX/SURF4 family)
MRLRENKENIEGRSLILNVSSIILNVIGVFFIAKGFHQSAGDLKMLFLSIGVLTFLMGLFGLVVLKGMHMFSFVARAFVGGLFIVSGLVKANDPWGFAFKLEEYFSPMGLTFDYPFFGWFHGYELQLSILICVAEIVLGVAVIVGGKIKLTSWLLVLLMIMFTWLTYYTFSCVDKNEALTALGLVAERDCVTDCGCFGDALKGSVGRSLTPYESFWKDLVLFYFVIIIFANQWKISFNSAKQNWIMVSSSLLVVVFFSWVFGWYFPIFFYLITILLAFVVGNMNIGKIEKPWKMAVFVALVSVLFSMYTTMYLPIKDYRGYAIGNNIIEKQNDGIPPIIERTYFYKNVNTSKVDTIAQSAWTADYSDKTKWEFIDSKDLIIDHGKASSISKDFVLTADYENLTKKELENKVLDSLVMWDFESYYENKIVQKSIYGVDTISDYEYQPFLYDTATYGPDTIFYEKLNAFTGLMDPTTPYQLDITPYILSIENVLLVTIRDIHDYNESAIDDLKEVYLKAIENDIPFYILSPASNEEIADFRLKHEFDAPFLSMDGIEVKILVRSNPGLLLISNATVLDKWPSRSIPSFEYIQTQYLKK